MKGRIGRCSQRMAGKISVMLEASEFQKITTDRVMRYFYGIPKKQSVTSPHQRWDGHVCVFIPGEQRFSPGERHWQAG